MSCYWECQSWSGTRAQGCIVLLSRGNIKADESCYAFVFARRGVNKMSHRKSTVWMVNRQVLALSEFLTGATKCFSEVWPVRVRGNSRQFMLINTEQRLHYLGTARRNPKSVDFKGKSNMQYLQQTLKLKYQTTTTILLSCKYKFACFSIWVNVPFKYKLINNVRAFRYG